MILSIIIPIYNVEHFVEKCIRSCENQDICKEDYELIVVNDGSKDNSLEIVNCLSEEYPNIRVLSQSNAGLSAARNTGINNALGEYYMFVDSDDWIAENCLSILTEKLKNEKPDALAICAANVINGQAHRRMSYLDETPIAGRDLLKKGVSPCAPFAIWSAKFFKKNNLSFFVGILHEDSELTPRAYYLAKKVSFTNELIYYVRQNPNSITRTPNPKRSFDLVNVVCNNLAKFEELVEPNYKYIFNNNVAMYLNNALAYICSSDKKIQSELNNTIYNNRHLFKNLMKSTQLKYRIEACVFFMLPKNCVQVYKIMTGHGSFI